VFLTTTPAIPGVRLVVGSVTVTTGADGRVATPVSDINGIASRVSLASTRLGRRHDLSLAFVLPAAHHVKYESHLTVGIDVTSTVRLRIDPGSTGVPAAQVQALRLHSVTGRTRLVDPRRTRTVRLTSRTARRAGSAAPEAITWTVDSLRVGGGSTFTSSRSAFDPFRSGTWRVQLRPVKGTVLVDTVPATPGATFVLDGATFTTDAGGQGTSSVADLNGVDQRLRLSNPQAAGVSVSIARIGRLAPGAAFQRHLVVALAVSRPVRLHFADLSGRPVPVDRVSEVRLDDGGRVVRVGGDELAEPVLLLSSVGRLVNGVWTPQPVTYSVTRVGVEGSNAVFSGQQRIDPAARRDWPVAASLFDVQVTVRDAIFGHQLRSGAQVVRPDGIRSSLVLAADRPTLMRSLVRGEYTLTTDSAVVGPDTRILVSKASDVDLRVVTLLDAVVVVVVVLANAGGLVVIGFALRRRAARAAETAS
jgi:hypothetical protein